MFNGGGFVDSVINPDAIPRATINAGNSETGK